MFGAGSGGGDKRSLPASAGDSLALEYMVVVFVIVLTGRATRVVAGGAFVEGGAGRKK